MIITPYALNTGYGIWEVEVHRALPEEDWLPNGADHSGFRVQSKKHRLQRQPRP